jgi:hypothetical protein
LRSAAVTTPCAQRISDWRFSAGLVIVTWRRTASDVPPMFSFPIRNAKRSCSDAPMASLAAASSDQTCFLKGPMAFLRPL